ncbi:MAG: MarR family transcriptional regulator [Phreatobacter sp.]|uniref:MarR family winged helix-turn-helix transcriptional regulator n=1 Tax=Phreatobacter sp. TaxID=1966341 RepID=UPI001A4CC959|nr:MarR family transcriptional regulator [Phreatobacter sp.]MBL8569377.1 MarR family transcriptional regulator [Phreatobacter sp.]
MSKDSQTGRKSRKAIAADASTAVRRRSTRQPPQEGIPVAPELSSSDNATDQLNNRIFFRLFQLGNELQRQSVQQLGITTVQWAVLGALSREKYASGIPLSQLGEYLVVTRQNLDGVLKRLERDGLVRRVADDGDKRSRIVRLTPRGRTFWKEIRARISLFYDQASAHFSFDARVSLVHSLNVLQSDLAKVELSKVGLPKRHGK